MSCADVSSSFPPGATWTKTCNKGRSRSIPEQCFSSLSPPNLFCVVFPIGYQQSLWLVRAGTLWFSFRRPPQEVRIYDGRTAEYYPVRITERPSTKSEDEGINFQDGRVYWTRNDFLSDCVLVWYAESRASTVGFSYYSRGTRTRTIRGHRNIRNKREPNGLKCLLLPRYPITFFFSFAFRGHSLTGGAKTFCVCCCSWELIGLLFGGVCWILCNPVACFVIVCSCQKIGCGSIWQLSFENVGIFLMGNIFQANLAELLKKSHWR